MSRIIAGAGKGRRLKTAAGDSTRPTGARVRQSLFDILAPLIPGCRFLDAFAGNGGVGLEALSRGAAKVVLVDKAALAVEDFQLRNRISDSVKVSDDYAQELELVWEIGQAVAAQLERAQAAPIVARCVNRLAEEMEEEKNAADIVQQLELIDARGTAVLMLDHQLGKRGKE